jgi:Arc/MetJ-type ribon-helix-helix transcriptional regulator
MKEVRISLSEERLAAAEAEVASGQFASISDLVDWALAEYLGQSLPTEEKMVAELAAMRAEVAEGGRLLDPDEVRQMVRDSLPK